MLIFQDNDPTFCHMLRDLPGHHFISYVRLLLPLNIYFYSAAEKSFNVCLHGAETKHVTVKKNDISRL